MYQIQMFPRFLTTPAAAVGCTRMVLKVPSGVLTSSRAFDLHRDRHVVHGVHHGNHEVLADLQGLR